MAKPIEDVKGIGPATAALLADSGIRSADDLAARQVEEIAAVRGFSQIRAERVLAAARELFVVPADQPVVVIEPAEKKEKKEKKNKADKEKNGKNKKKKEKALPKKGKNSKKEKKSNGKKKDKKKGKKKKK